MINIALLQVDAKKSIKENECLGLQLCERCKNQNVDIIVFPEMWSTGYYIPQTKEELSKFALSLDSDFINAFIEKAKEIKIAILITFLEKKDSNFFNSATLITKEGQVAYTYRKVHTCDFGDEGVLTSGDDFYVYNLETNHGNINVGTMICYDREFPESARILMLKGAELILVPNACPLEINRISQLRGSAYENMLAIATVNYPIMHDDCNGCSNIFDGIAYREDEPTSRDTLILQADEDENIYIASIPIEELRKYRSKEVHGNCYRHPNKYKLLLDDRVEAPFIRTDKNK